MNAEHAAKRIANFYKNMKQAKLDADRDDLVRAIDCLVQEAETFKRQIADGHIYNANLTQRGQVVDELATSMRYTTDAIGLLDEIAEHDISQEG